eukprot:3656673-Rhodomonas_salina.2
MLLPGRRTQRYGAYTLTPLSSYTTYQTRYLFLVRLRAVRYCESVWPRLLLGTAWLRRYLPTGRPTRVLRDIRY